MNGARKSAVETMRRAELGKIHVGKKRLGLDDTTYRGIIARVCDGKTSAAELDERERRALLDEFKRLGFREGASYTKSLDEFDDREPQAKLIRCLWADLAALGALRDPSEKGLRRLVKRVAKVDSLAWLGPQEANAVIEALKQRRRWSVAGARLSRAERLAAAELAGFFI
ncbi:MAG TPA: regulatory protein GemA [Candidatus Binataceae bacterium]|nr:regulatory protein GemA [Candidatus Binataceae bacterium]